MYRIHVEEENKKPGKHHLLETLPTTCMKPWLSHPQMTIFLRQPPQGVGKTYFSHQELQSRRGVELKWLDSGVFQVLCEIWNHPEGIVRRGMSILGSPVTEAPYHYEASLMSSLLSAEVHQAPVRPGCEIREPVSLQDFVSTVAS